MLFVACCLISIIGGSFGTPQANQYVDTLLHTTLQNVIKNEKLDPTHLPNFTFEYKDKTFFGKVKGEADYTDGSLIGLAQVQRYAECEGPRNVSILTSINCTLSFNNIKTTHKGKVKYGVLPKVSINADGKADTTLIDVEFVKVSSEKDPRVKTFRLRKVGRLSAEFTGLGPLNKYMDILEKNYSQRVGGEMVNVINNRFLYALNLAAKQVPMPLR